MLIDLLCVAGVVCVITGLLQRRRPWGPALVVLGFAVLATSCFLSASREIPPGVTNIHDVEDQLLIRWGAKILGVIFVGAAVTAGWVLGKRRSTT